MWNCPLGGTVCTRTQWFNASTQRCAVRWLAECEWGSVEAAGPTSLAASLKPSPNPGFRRFTDDILRVIALVDLLHLLNAGDLALIQQKLNVGCISTTPIGEYLHREQHLEGTYGNDDVSFAEDLDPVIQPDSRHVCLGSVIDPRRLQASLATHLGSDLSHGRLRQ